jgi:hypothetical protein
VLANPASQASKLGCLALHAHNSIDSAEFEKDDTRPGRDVPHVLSTAVLVEALASSQRVECGQLFQTVTAFEHADGHMCGSLMITPPACPTLRVQLEEGKGGGEHEVKAVVFRELHLFLPHVQCKCRSAQSLHGH